MFPETSGKLFGNFFVTRRHFVTNEITTILQFLKVQIHGWKHVFYFHKSWKIPRGKFPPEKIPRKIFLTISSNFKNFFSDRGTFRKILRKISDRFIYKKYNLPALNKCLYPFISKLYKMFPETSGKLFWKFPVT